MNEQRADKPANMTLVETSSTSRPGASSSWASRISWGAVFAGAFVAIAVQLLLSSLAVWGGFGQGKLTSIAAFQTQATTTAVWIGVFGLISLFAGGVVATRLSGSGGARSASWHALTVWGVTITAMTVLSSLGIAGLLGYGVDASAAVKSIPGVSAGIAVTLTRTTSAAVKYEGYYLLFSAVSLVTAILGGWLGSMGMSRGQARVVSTPVSESDEVRRAA